MITLIAIIALILWVIMDKRFNDNVVYIIFNELFIRFLGVFILLSGVIAYIYICL
mgnify:CR=1 FL=1